MQFHISVVVPTYKRASLLDCCLGALAVQQLDPASYEIIVVDDAASDQTRQQVESWAQRLSTCGQVLRYIPVTGNHGPAAARNLGWRAAQSEIIAFTDDDCLPTPQWLRAGLNACKDGVAGVSGKILVPLPHAPSDYERNAAHLENSQFVTANCFYRHDVLQCVGGFDERFTAAWREDTDLLFNLLERGATLVFEPRAIVIHPIRSAPWGISLKQQRKSMFNALLYNKHPYFYRRKVQATPPWHYYAILCAFVLALVSLLKRSPLHAIVATFLWLSLTTRFCAQRLQGTSHTPGHVTEMILTSILIPPLAIFWRIRGAVKFRVLFL